MYRHPSDLNLHAICESVNFRRKSRLHAPEVAKECKETCEGLHWIHYHLHQQGEETLVTSPLKTCSRRWHSKTVSGVVMIQECLNRLSNFECGI